MKHVLLTLFIVALAVSARSEPGWWVIEGSKAMDSAKINEELEKVLPCGVLEGTNGTNCDNTWHAHDCPAFHRPAVSELITRLVAEARREALEEAAIFVTQRDRLEFSTGALGRHHIAEAIRALASEAGKEQGDE